MESLELTIRDYILSEFLPGIQASELKDDTPLISGGILDSLATVQLVSYLEDSFGIEFQPHEIDRDNFDSVHHIAELIRSKKSLQ